MAWTCDIAHKCTVSRPDEQINANASPRSGTGEDLGKLVNQSPVARVPKDLNGWSPDEVVELLLANFEPAELQFIFDVVFRRCPSMRANIFALHPEEKRRPEENLSLSNIGLCSEAKAGDDEQAQSLLPLADSSLGSPGRMQTVLEPTAQSQQSDAQPSPYESSSTLTVPAAIIQFGSGMYYGGEEEEDVKVDVMRLGDSSGVTTVKYITVDKSAKAGLKYHHTAGTLTFRPGEFVQEFKIKVIEDERWDATLDFAVELHDVVNGKLGRHLRTCRVKIIDDDAFPTNRYKKMCEEMQIGQLSKWKLFVEYARMNFSDPTIRRASLKCMLLDQVENLQMMMRLIVRLYLLDVILDPDVGDDHPLKFGLHYQTLLLLVCLAVVIPETLACRSKIIRTESKIGGLSRFKLQANLMRKFLSFDEAVRASLKLSDVILSITHHAPEIVKGGYMSLFKLLEQFSKMLLLVGFQCVVASRQHSFQAVLPGLIPGILLPCLMFLFLRHRHEITQTRRLHEMMEEQTLANDVEHITSHCRILTDYQRRGHVMDSFEKQVRQLNVIVNLNHVTHMVNSQFAPWLECLAIGLYMYFGGRQVIAGQITVGAFVTAITVYGRVADAITVMYESVLVLHHSLPALELVVFHMNLPTDLRIRKDMSRKNTLSGKELRVRSREELKRRRESGEVHMENVYAVDLLPIQLRKISFWYSKLQDTSQDEHNRLRISKHSKAPGFSKISKLFRRCSNEDLNDISIVSNDGKSAMDSSAAEETDQLSLNDITLEIRQGEVVVLVGRKGQGKTTLLKILGGVLLPQLGEVFIPSHLRVIHVEQQPVFFNTTLLQNLRYGVDGNAMDKDGSIERILQVCRRLTIPDKILKLIESDVVLHWDRCLSLTQRAALHLIRAIIANPNVLVLHKPTLSFDATTGDLIMQMLQEFVAERGVDVAGNKYYRRMRTCIITGKDNRVCSFADTVVCVSKSGVEEVPDQRNLSAELFA